MRAQCLILRPQGPCAKERFLVFLLTSICSGCPRYTNPKTSFCHSEISHFVDTEMYYHRMKCCFKQDVLGNGAKNFKI